MRGNTLKSPSLISDLKKLLYLPVIWHLSRLELPLERFHLSDDILESIIRFGGTAQVAVPRG